MKKILFGLLFLVSACSPFRPFTFVQMTDPQIGFELSEERTDTMFKAAVAGGSAVMGAERGSSLRYLGPELAKI